MGMNRQKRIIVDIMEEIQEIQPNETAAKTKIPAIKEAEEITDPEEAFASLCYAVKVFANVLKVEALRKAMGEML